MINKDNKQQNLFTSESAIKMHIPTCQMAKLLKARGK